MKKLLFDLVAIGAIIFAAINMSDGKNAPVGQGVNNTGGINNTNMDTIRHGATIFDKVQKAGAIAASMHAKAPAFIQQIVGHYLHIKNALANDNGSDAASGAKAMEEIIGKIDKSSLASVQKKGYDAFAGGLKNQAGHIGNNGDNIKLQREHFSMMSEDVYGLVKAFESGRALYHYYCPV